MKKKRKVTESSHNVFKDLGFQDARELAIKSDLGAAIYRSITTRGFKNQTEAAVLMGIDQPRVSKLIRGYFDEYSAERLLEFAQGQQCHPNNAGRVGGVHRSRSPRFSLVGQV